MRSNIKKYAVEFAVIFLSITFSFVVEEWRSTRQEKKVTKQFLQRLKAELTEKTVRTQRYLNHNKKVLKNLEKIAINFKTREIKDDTLLLYLFESESNGMFNPELETWESLKSSGVLATIEPEVIDSVNSLLKKYRVIGDLDKEAQELFVLTWPMFLSDIPPNEVTDQWIMFFQKGDYLLNGKRYEPGKRSDFNKFLNNSIAIDYFFTKVLRAGGTVEYFQSIPEQEKRLIELLEKQLEE
ncbi:MAG TPA: hypothetical protein VIT44_02335 [Cyclobacteriaceae bacterium]